MIDFPYEHPRKTDLPSLVEEPEELASGLLPSGLVLVHDAEGRRQHQVAEPTGGKNVLHPLLKVCGGYIEARGDDSALVDSADELDDDLARPVVVDHLELSDISCQTLNKSLSYRWPYHFFA